MKNLNDLFEHEIMDLYSAEKQLTESFQNMIDESSDSKLMSLLINYKIDIHNHYIAIRNIVDEININPRNTVCQAMEGLIKEWEGLLRHDLSDDVKDAGLIARIQRIMHYEISAYGTAARYARDLDKDNIAKTLQAILNEKYVVNDKLGELAKERINEEALA